MPELEIKTAESEQKSKIKTDSPPLVAIKESEKTQKIWMVLWFVLASFGFGYLGGTVADNTSNDGLLDTGASTQLVLQESEVIADIAERVGPSVVSISVNSETQTTDLFFGSRTFESQSAGTGIILSGDGLVVTNKHVIPENTTSMTITLNDGREFENVEIIGRDPFQDIAYLKIKGAKNLTAAEVGDSSVLRTGDKVVAIGNALGEFQGTVTSGIISGLSRPVETFDRRSEFDTYLQTDAAINPGNSGGPLLNINGEVIGINTAIASNSENIGFAIPINDVKPGISSVEKNGELVRPYLGVRFVMLNETIAADLELSVDKGALVNGDSNQRAVLPESPAANAGIREEDIILSIDNEELTQDFNLATAIGQKQVGDTITLEVLRGEETLTLETVLEAVPEQFVN